MRRKTKVFLLIVFVVFIACTIETVLKTKFVPSKNYGYEISEITKNISVSEKNVLIVNEALRLKFNEPYSQAFSSDFSFCIDCRILSF